MAALDDVGGGASSARLRGERRLRSHLRHERLAISVDVAQRTEDGQCKGGHGVFVCALKRELRCFCAAAQLVDVGLERFEMWPSPYLRPRSRTWNLLCGAGAGVHKLQEFQVVGFPGACSVAVLVPQV